MPEGDTIFRTAESMQRWIGGKTVTAARSTAIGPAIERVVGSVVEAVEPRAKHLLLRFSCGLSLHTHMRMTGSWHLYKTDDRWHKPGTQARVVISCGERMAVCFNAPVVELLSSKQEREHTSLAGLGPDVLGRDPFDYLEVRLRAARCEVGYTIGELLLDQRVVSGIGNIYRCEALFAERCNPWRPASSLGEGELDALLAEAVDQMKIGVSARSRLPRAVYRRAGRPCRACGTVIESSQLGSMPRTIYWCPCCQALDVAETGFGSSHSSGA